MKKNLYIRPTEVRYIWMKRIFELLENEYAIIKGESLSLFAYKKEGRRISNDIDLLIDKSYLKSIEEILYKHGFTSLANERESRILCLSASHQVSPFYKTIDTNIIINLDINFDIFWGEYRGRRIDIKDFLSDTIEIDVYGCKIKTLVPLKAMIQLVLHHYKEMNSIYHLAGHNCINYNMFKDVYYLWKNNQEPISLEKLYDMSLNYEIIPYIFYVLHFTNQIFNDFDLEKYVEAFKTSAGVALLNYYGLSEKERKPWKVDFKTRLKTENMYDLIKDDLTESDFEKLERNRRIFGE